MPCVGLNTQRKCTIPFYSCARSNTCRIKIEKGKRRRMYHQVVMEPVTR